MDFKQDTLILKALEEAVQKNEEWFLQAIQTIQNEGVSNYPILVAYPNTTNVEIGLAIRETERFSFNATTLEELAMKKIINLEKVNEFRTLFKEKKDMFCVFLIDQPAPQFIFVPVKNKS